ncbi:MAG: RNA methyltransferase [Verrucomicrobia bacterium]|nr:RNA methyltransferase [Verrucomicrobiota bacterium]
MRLKDGTHRRRQQKFVIEGSRELERALDCQWPIETLFFCPDLLKHDVSWACLHRCEECGVELVELTENALQKCAYRENPEGLLAVAPFRNSTLDLLTLKQPPFLLVVERVEKPGNIGALLRTADAAGVHAVLFCDPVTDLYNPNAIRASQGAFFSMPTVVTDSITARLWLEDKAVHMVATSPAADKVVWDTNLKGPLALIVGAEDSGLSEDWLNADIHAVTLPMEGVTDSLNVSVAAAVVLFEAVRQRRA